MEKQKFIYVAGPNIVWDKTLMMDDDEQLQELGLNLIVLGYLNPSGLGIQCSGYHFCNTVYLKIY